MQFSNSCNMAWSNSFKHSLSSSLLCIWWSIRGKQHLEQCRLDTWWGLTKVHLTSRVVCRRWPRDPTLFQCPKGLEKWISRELTMTYHIRRMIFSPQHLGYWSFTILLLLKLLLWPGGLLYTRMFVNGLRPADSDHHTHKQIYQCAGTCGGIHRDDIWNKTPCRHDIFSWLLTIASSSKRDGKHQGRDDPWSLGAWSSCLHWQYDFHGRIHFLSHLQINLLLIDVVLNANCVEQTNKFPRWQLSPIFFGCF